MNDLGAKFIIQLFEGTILTFFLYSPIYKIVYSHYENTNTKKIQKRNKPYFSKARKVHCLAIINFPWTETFIQLTRKVHTLIGYNRTYKVKRKMKKCQNGDTPLIGTTPSNNPR